MTFYILHLTFMIPFIFHIRAVPVKLFVGIVGVLATTPLRSICQSSIWYTSLQSVQMVPLPDGWGWFEIDNKRKPLLDLASSSIKSLSRASEINVAADKGVLADVNARKPIYLVQV